MKNVRYKKEYYYIILYSDETGKLYTSYTYLNVKLTSFSRMNQVARGLADQNEHSSVNIQNVTLISEGRRRKRKPGRI